MCGWKKTTANRRQAESRVKLAWICRGAKEEDEVNRRHAGRHELFPMAGTGGEGRSQPTPSREQSQACLAMPRREGGRRSQPTDNHWTYWESQQKRYCQI